MAPRAARLESDAVTWSLAQLSDRSAVREDADAARQSRRIQRSRSLAHRQSRWTAVLTRLAAARNPAASFSFVTPLMTMRSSARLALRPDDLHRSRWHHGSRTRRPVVGAERMVAGMRGLPRASLRHRLEAACTALAQLHTVWRQCRAKWVSAPPFGDVWSSSTTGIASCAPAGILSPRRPRRSLASSCRAGLALASSRPR